MIHRSRAKHIVNRMEADRMTIQSWPWLVYVMQCFSLSTIETDVSSREEEGDHVGEGPGGRHHRPEQRDREDDQGGGEVESVDIAQTQH